MRPASTPSCVCISAAANSHAADVAGVQVDDSILPADVVVIAMGPWSSAAAKWVPGFPHVEGDKVRLATPCAVRVAMCRTGMCHRVVHAVHDGVQATSVVVRPAADIPAQMLFTEYRDEKGEDPLCCCFSSVSNVIRAEPRGRRGCHALCAACTHVSACNIMPPLCRYGCQ